MKRIATLAIFLALYGIVVCAQTVDSAKQLYQGLCVGCHGEDGTGGGHGPSFLDVRRPRATSLEAVRNLIIKGIPDGGMPAFKMPDSQADALAAYVMALKKPAAVASAGAASPGDPAAGERFFAGKGNCGNCHMVRGRGGVLGPDLSNVGRDRNPAQIEQALRDPGAAAATPAGRGGRGGRGAAPTYRAVTVRLRDGQTLRGIAKNESTFDLQLLAVDGKLHLLSKDQIAEIVREKSLMPKVEASPEELRNLVAYLSRLSADPNAKAMLATGELGPGVPFADVAHPKPGSWPTYNGSMSGNRFSPLNQINTANVQQLAPQWIFPVASSPRPLQVTPVVVDGVMYVTSVNEAYALDARNGREIWHYSRPRSQGLAGDAASGINRGVAVLGDRVFMVSDNAHLFALHRFTGQLIWDVEMADSHQNYGSTSAPLVVNDLVIAGVSGGDEGVRGFLDAYKASTGERAWRFWTVPARRRARVGDVERPRHGTRLRRDVADRHVRSRSAPALLADRQSLPRLQRRRAEGRQPLHGFGAGARSGDGKTEMALPVHAARSARLGRHGNAGAGGRDVSRPAAEAAAARKSQRLLLRAGPPHRQGAGGGTVRQEADLGQRYRAGRPPHPAAG